MSPPLLGLGGFPLLLNTHRRVSREGIVQGQRLALVADIARRRLPDTSLCVLDDCLAHNAGYVRARKLPESLESLQFL